MNLPLKLIIGLIVISDYCYGQFKVIKLLDSDLQTVSEPSNFNVSEQSSNSTNSDELKLIESSSETNVIKIHLTDHKINIIPTNATTNKVEIIENSTNTIESTTIAGPTVELSPKPRSYQSN